MYLVNRNGEIVQENVEENKHGCWLAHVKIGINKIKMIISNNKYKRPFSFVGFWNPSYDRAIGSSNIPGE